ncbi:MAG: DinB family protein [Anaerolineae bacterium]
MSKRIVLLQALAAALSNLMLLLQDVDPQSFGLRPSPDMWSAADVLSHLLAVEAQYRQRLQRVLVEERPFLPLILPDETKHNLSVTPSEFAAARQQTLAFLRDVPEAGWGRTAVHETQGEVTFQFLVQYLVDHDSQHLNQIAMIQQQLNAAPDRKAQPAISES